MNAKVASSVFWKFLERGVFATVQFVVQILLARLLAPNDFGALAIILAFTNVGIVVSQSGLNIALVQDPDVTERDYSTVFWMCLTVSVGLFLAIFFSAPAIAAGFGNPGLSWPLRIMSFILLVNSFTSIAMARLMRHMNFKMIFVASAAAVIISGTAGVLCAIGGLGLWALVVQQVGYYAVMTIPLAISANWHPHIEFEPHRAKALFSFGSRLLAANLLDAAYQSLADLLIGKRFDPYNLGLVSQGKRWPQAVGYLLDGSIQPVTLSAVSRIQNDTSAVKSLLRTMLSAYTYLMFPLMAFFIVCAEPIVLLLLGEQWLPCVPFFRLFCVVYAMLPINTTNIQAISGLGRSDLLLKLEVVKKTYSVVLLLLSVFVIGDIYVVVGSYVIAGVISLFVTAMPTARLCGYPISEQLRDIAPAFAASCASAALALPVSLLQLSPAIELACQLTLTSCAYIGISCLFKMAGLRYARQALTTLLSRRGEDNQSADSSNQQAAKTEITHVTSHRTEENEE